MAPRIPEIMNTFTQEEIETALTWHRRPKAEFFSQEHLILIQASKREDLTGTYDQICEHILRTHIQELENK